MFGTILQSERPIPGMVKLVRRIYLAGLIPTVIYKKIVTSLTSGNTGIAGDIVLETHRGNILIDSDDVVGRDLFLYLCFDRNVIAFFRHLFTGSKNATMLDIGSNIGNHAIWLASCFERVLCFEPNPVAFKYLSRNGKTHENIELFQIGLSTDSGTALLESVDENNLGMARIPVEPSDGAFEISLEAGDNFLADHAVGDVDFIKIDVEGHEWEVLNGLQKTIRTRLPIIVLEYHHETAEKSGHGLQEFLSDYVLYGMVGLPKSAQLRALKEGVTLSPFDDRQQYNNVLCIPKKRREEIEARFPGAVWRDTRCFKAPDVRVL